MRARYARLASLRAAVPLDDPPRHARRVRRRRRPVRRRLRSRSSHGRRVSYRRRPARRGVAPRAAELLVAVDEQLLGDDHVRARGRAAGRDRRPGTRPSSGMLAVSPAARAAASAQRSVQHVVDDDAAGAAPASSARASPRCAPRTASTSGSASRATRSATGRRCRASTCSPSLCAQQVEQLGDHRRALDGGRRDEPDRVLDHRVHERDRAQVVRERVGFEPRVGGDAGQPGAGVGDSVETELVSTAGLGVAPAAANAPSTIRRCCMSGVSRHSGSVGRLRPRDRSPKSSPAGVTSR